MADADSKSGLVLRLLQACDVRQLGSWMLRLMQGAKRACSDDAEMDNDGGF